MNKLVFKPPRGAVALPDTERYKGRFEIGSASSDRIYRISFDVALMAWVCSCPGAITHGQCKHLSAAGLKGRKYGRQEHEAKKFGFVS